jgi:hypothetical protein
VSADGGVVLVVMNYFPLQIINLDILHHQAENLSQG